MAFNVDKKTISIGLVLAVSLSGLIGYYAAAQRLDVGPAAAAIVNGRFIPTAEIDAMAQRGVDRAVALDSAVNRSVFASAAEAEFGPQAAGAVATATREALAQTFISESTKVYLATITDAELKAWFDKNITAADYSHVKAKYVLVGTQDVAMAAVDAARAGDTKRFEPMAKGDGFMPALSMPYGIGQSLSKLKAGDVAGPVVVREGFLVVYLDAIREGTPPAFEASKETIKTILVQEKLAGRLKELRAKAVITIK